MAPKRKSSDANNSDMPKRSHKVYIGGRFGAIHGFGHPLEAWNLSERIREGPLC